MKSNALFSIRWKLIVAFLVVVIIPILLLRRHALDFFDRFTRGALEQEMVAYALIIGEQYRSMVLEAPPETRAEMEARFQRILSRCGPDILSRLRIIDREGTVRFDSHDDSTIGKDFSARPEVARALEGKYGSSCSLTDDRQFMYYYIAHPLLDREGNVLAVAMVSRHTNPIIQAIDRMKTDQSRALYAAAAAAVAVAVLLSFTITRRLRTLTRAAGKTAGTGTGAIPRIKGKDEIGALARSLETMTKELDRRNLYNRDFVSETLHELKTPLTSIIGAVELLEGRAGEESDSRRRFLSNIRHDAERMHRLVGELSRLTLLDTESMESARETVNYPDFLLGVLGRAEEAFERPRARIEVDITAEECPVDIVPGRMEQVILNLLENAFRYTPPEGTVTVSVSKNGREWVVTEVADTGSGIAAANLERVFDRFFTTVPRDRERGFGSGLGLAIARRIIEKHAGTIEVESAPGKGSVFRFRLPLAPAKSRT
ncbi:MAG TPA: ATP-binding protein [bacterium]|nr:ATP-binding protein [bacterium]HPQ65936.1 ATP-binding protein [bacterium]